MPFHDDFYEIDDLLYIARHARIERGKMFPKRNRFQPFNNHRWFEERRKLFSQPLPLQQLGMQAESLSPDTQNMYAVPNPNTGPIPIDTQPTVIVSAVRPIQRPKMTYPPYTYYRSVDNPLLRLYGAVIAFKSQHRHLPSVLAISSRIEPMLALESFAFMGKEYAGRFYFVHPEAIGSIKSLPILTERDLPPLLALAIGQSIDTDLVIAIGEY